MTAGSRRLLRVLASFVGASFAGALVACSGTNAPLVAAPAPTGGTLAQLAVTETPLAADTLAGSIGLNANIVSGTNPAGATDWQTLLSLLNGLGVRHIRDGILDADPPYDTAMMQILSASNAKLDGITDCAAFQNYPGSATSTVQIQQFDTAIANGLEYVEGPNEVDLRNDANWAADTIACLPSLVSAEPSLPFIAPSISNQQTDAPELGNISASVNDGNLHRYYSGRNPETSGWGGRSSCGIYGALSWALCESAINSGTEPVIITETGYDDVGEVDVNTQAKYLVRAMFFDLQAGVSTTYVYAFRDSTSGSFSGDGLIRTNDSTKPSYTALNYLMKYFNDPGAPVATVPLDYSIQASGSSIEHLLFQKRDGTYVLALWNGTASWDTTTNTEIAVAPQVVAVTLEAAPAGVSAVTINAAGHLADESTSTSLDTMSLSVDDYLTFLNFSTPSQPLGNKRRGEALLHTQ